MIDARRDHQKGSVTFIGRSDGLGNRMEEVIVLNAFSRKFDCDIAYYFSNLNARADRTYPRLFKVANPRFTVKPLESRLARLGIKAMARLSKSRAHTSTDVALFRDQLDANDLRHAAKDIEPDFAFIQSFDAKTTAIHLRASDRIHPSRGPHFLKSRDVLHENINLCLAHLARQDTGTVLAFSEEPGLLDLIEQTYDNASRIPAATSTSGGAVPAEYRDFFALTKCKNIVLAGAPSSFCLTAALIGGGKVSYAYLPEEFIKRFPVDYHHITKANPQLPV